MKKLEQLKDQVFSLKTAAENLKEMLIVVGNLPTFPEKLRAMEVISEASWKMNEVAELIEGVPENASD